MASGVIFDIKEMSVNDGPGIRTTVFFKGCPLRCNWCHNPEGFEFKEQLKEAGTPCTRCDKCHWNCSHEDCQPFNRCVHVCPIGRLSVCGRKVDSTLLISLLKRQESFLLRNGGVTLSGGEPLMQSDFLNEVMIGLKPLHLAVETSSHVDSFVYKEMMKQADLVITDIKHMDNKVHKYYTGVGNMQILSNIRQLIKSDHQFIVRVPLIPGVNDDDENLQETAQFLSGARGLVRVELMPYNYLAGAKYKSVGMEYKPVFDVTARPNSNCMPFISSGIPCVVL